MERSVNFLGWFTVPQCLPIPSAGAALHIALPPSVITALPFRAPLVSNDEKRQLMHRYLVPSLIKVNRQFLLSIKGLSPTTIQSFRSFQHSGTMGADEFVESLLKTKKVVVFSKSFCPYCKKAKEALAKFKFLDGVYVVVELDQEKPDEMDEIQNYMKKKTGASSVPRVFIDGKFIGGGDDTVKLEKSGELKKLLENAGAL